VPARHQVAQGGGVLGEAPQVVPPRRPLAALPALLVLPADQLLLLGSAEPGVLALEALVLEVRLGQPRRRARLDPELDVGLEQQEDGIRRAALAGRRQELLPARQRLPGLPAAPEGLQPLLARFRGGWRTQGGQGGGQGGWRLG